MVQSEGGRQFVILRVRCLDASPLKSCKSEERGNTGIGRQCCVDAVLVAMNLCNGLLISLYLTPWRYRLSKDLSYQ